jgi:hypothetical protein
MASGSKQWFKFYSARWLSSATIQQMSAAERGVFINLIVAYDLFGPLPKDHEKLGKLVQTDARTVKKWLEKWRKLVEDMPQARDNEAADSPHVCDKFVVRKFDVLQDLMQKTSADEYGEETRREETKKRTSFSSSQKKSSVPSEANHPVPVDEAPVESDNESPVIAESQPSSQAPLEWTEDVDGIPAGDIRRAILYVSSYSENTWYRDKLSPGFIRRNARKLVEEVPLGWEPPQPKIKKAADPNCQTCRGRGLLRKAVPNSLAFVHEPCECLS